MLLREVGRQLGRRAGPGYRRGSPAHRVKPGAPWRGADRRRALSCGGIGASSLTEAATVVGVAEPTRKRPGRMAEQNPETPEDDLVQALRGTRALVGVIARIADRHARARDVAAVPGAGAAPGARDDPRRHARRPPRRDRLHRHTARLPTRPRRLGRAWCLRGGPPVDQPRAHARRARTSSTRHAATAERALNDILRTMPPADRVAAVDGLRRMADAAGEPSPESLDVLAYDRPSEA